MAVNGKQSKSAVPKGSKPNRGKSINPAVAERRRTMTIRIVGTLVVVVIAAAVGIGLIATKKDDSPGKKPSVASANNSFIVTNGGPPQTPGQPAIPAKATLTIVEDFQCPVCKQFEEQFGAAIKQVRALPNLTVEYKPIAFLNQMSTTDYSSRAANASSCVAEATASGGKFDTWLTFHNALYAQQPPEQSAGLPDDTLKKMATDAGAPASVGSCIDDGTYKKWMDSVTTSTLKNGVQGTPTVFLNGTKMDLSTPEKFIEAVTAATK